MRSIAFTFLSLVMINYQYAQGVCSGNLGDNIFTIGDFGSGSAPILVVDPGIAPGYNYTTNVPNDGSYTICSNTGYLAGLYGTWLAIGDNSSDPNGYMMVVNASFSPGIFYEELVEGLCENTLYEFSADIINMIKIGVSGHIDPNVSFLIDGVEVYTTGIVPKTGKWEQYGFTFVTSSSQNALTLTLRNNAPGGIGNDLALDNISFRPCGPASFIGIENDTTIFLCIDDDPLIIFADIEGVDGQEFATQWQLKKGNGIWMDVVDSTNNTITHNTFVPGDYYYRYYSAANEVNILNEKCRIISDEIKITILPDIYNQTDTLCVGLVYEFGTQKLTSSGSYSESFQSFLGCDSIVFLDLIFMPSLDFDFNTRISHPSCYGFDDGYIEVNSIEGGYGEIVFTLFDSNGNMGGISFVEGQFYIIATDRYGCEDVFNVELINPDEISVDLPADTVTRLGDELYFLPDYSHSFFSISWAGSGIFDCINCDAVTYLPFYDGFATVKVSDDNGCQASDSILVVVDHNNVVEVPNIFSPNGDLINDFFTINYYERSVSRLIEFSIFDRWGNQLIEYSNFIAENGQPIWDGYVGQKVVAPGVYAYRMDIELINGERLLKIGDVTVIH